MSIPATTRLNAAATGVDAKRRLQGAPATVRRRGLTLIELLVVVVIMTTLVAGVIPLLSPNNDSRKIREAARELHTFIVKAQAEAARTGRPYGIGFREIDSNAPDSVDSGFALEAYAMAEPAPFAGFTDYSRVYLLVDADPNDGIQGQVDGLQFITYTPPDVNSGTLEGYSVESMPPLLLRRGDVVEVDGARYEITDGDRDGDNGNDSTSNPPFVRGDYYTALNNPSTFQKSFFLCRPVKLPAPTLPLAPRQILSENRKQLIPCNPLRMAPLPQGSAAKPYVIHRQPAPASGEPLTFPRAIGIDLVASGFDTIRWNALLPTYPANGYPTQCGRLISQTQTTLNNDRPACFSPKSPLNVSVMFAPSGRIDSVVVNGEQQTGYSKFFILVGRVENALAGLRADGYPAIPAAADLSGVSSEDDYRKARSEANWLNEDSRWVTITARNGRSVVSDNAYVDPASPADLDGDGTNLPQDYDDQVTAARRLANEMMRLGEGQ